MSRKRKSGKRKTSKSRRRKFGVNANVRARSWHGYKEAKQAQKDLVGIRELLSALDGDSEVQVIILDEEGTCFVQK